MSQDESKKKIYDFLKDNFVMSIAVSVKNKPISSVVIYYVEEDFNLYFMTHKDSFKAKALIDNPQISLSIWEKHKMLVQVDGNVEEIENQGHVEKYLDKLAEVSAKDPEFWPPLLKVKGNGYTVFKIIPKWLRSMDLEGDEMKQKESPFTEITFE